MTELEYETALKEAMNNRKYPDVGEQLDALYRVMSTAGETNEFTELISAVKAAGVKPELPAEFSDAMSTEDAYFAEDHDASLYPSSKYE